MEKNVLYYSASVRLWKNCYSYTHTPLHNQPASACRLSRLIVIFRFISGNISLLPPAVQEIVKEQLLHQGLSKIERIFAC